MNKFVNAFVFFGLIFQISTSLAQRSTIFLNQNPLEHSGTIPLRLPTELYEGLQPTSDTTFGTRVLASMQATYAKARPYDKHGIAASVLVNGLPQWSGAIGYNDISTPMDTNLEFEIASCTKTFTAALIMKLQDEGKLSIKDSIYKYLPKFKNIDSTITIEQLLNHSSGIYDVVNDDPNQTALADMYEYDPSHVWTSIAVLDSFVGPPNFKPGKSYRYSNTNFLLLGLIAERVGGGDLGLQLHRNFIDTLHLTHTYVGGEDQIAPSFAHNWISPDTTVPSQDLFTIDKTAQLTGARGDGNMVSTPGDLVRWVRKLYTGQLLSKSALNEMLTMHRWSDGSSYGLGTQFAPFYSKSLYGHSGHLPGFETEMFTNPKDSVSFVVYLNFDAAPADGAMLNDMAIDILNAVYFSPSGVAQTAEPTGMQHTLSPNPTTGQTTLAYRLDRSSNVRLIVYDELGREVRDLLEGDQTSGVHTTSIDLSALRNGTYFYTIQSSQGFANGKISLEH